MYLIIAKVPVCKTHCATVPPSHSEINILRFLRQGNFFDHDVLLSGICRARRFQHCADDQIGMCTSEVKLHYSPTYHTLQDMKDEMVDFVGLNASDNGRSCSNHMICGAKVEVGSVLLVRFEPSIQGGALGVYLIMEFPRVVLDSLR